LVARRVEVMREMLPQAQRIIVFADPYSADQVETARKAAAAALFQLLLVQFTNQPYDYLQYLQERRGVAADTFMSLSSPIFVRDRTQIQAALTRLRVPGIGTNPLQAEAGYLMSYGSNIQTVTRRLAAMGARLLGGRRPSETPVEQAADFEFVINAGTARTFGVRLPDSLVARATRIVH
jgi:putative tryptophan/tyrosine transport system substrate-binding protein